MPFFYGKIYRFFENWGQVKSNKVLSKKTNNIPTQTQTPGWGYGYVVSSDIQDRLVGNLLEIIEAIGLPEKQETSIKSLIREKVWKVFESAIYITDKRHSEIRELYYKLKSEHKGEFPMSAI